MSDADEPRDVYVTAAERLNRHRTATWISEAQFWEITNSARPATTSTHPASSDYWRNQCIPST